MTSLSKPVFSNSKLGLVLIVATMIGMATLYAPLADAAPIYKVIDEKTGQVTFTDRPQNYEQQAGKKISQTGVTTKESRVSSSNSDNTSSQPPSSNVNTTTQNTAAKNSPVAKPVVNYQLNITEPSAEAFN